jgi:hypothetical protein
MDRVRAVAGALLAVAMLALAPLAAAQDARSVLVQKTARDWLALADKDDGAGTWKAAGKKFQESMSSLQWSQALVQVRMPIGKTIQRTMVSTTFDKSFAGAPEGDYAHVEFRTSFEGRPDGHETISLERESDGVWRVIGYSIH